MGANDLAGRRVLVVEDESLIAMLIEDALEDLGCALAGVASTLKEALERARGADFDVAILDVNLNGQSALPVAELLAGKGVPFVFSTGYGAAGLPDAFSGAPVLAKPFVEGDVGRALAQALAPRP